ncbi:hypothetical protein [Rhodoplanes serenus]|uniref:COG3904 family protein n=1 Tax=Rhodoplanes serenus TaxID=200615 RepID=UPI000DACD0A0|nr:hypothetical protein [Rhodoplanes serenus]RAI30287.1 hypothetical protein CH340_22030 [Rhodoplanes serenus]
MKRSWVGGLALALCALPVVAATPELPANPRTLPMQFVVQEPAVPCGKDCRSLVFAAGMITADTPRRFEAFAAERSLRDATVVLDSDGGSVVGALAFGRSIRRLGLDTTVGRADRSGGPGKPARIAPANCESMCAFVLLGGVAREVPARSRVLVHQIWLGDRRDDAVAASYSAEDLVLVQRDIGQIVRYTADMGGAAELIEIALRIPPWEPMRLLSRDELRRTGLDREAPPPAVAATQASAAVTPVAVSMDRAAAASERGWSVVEGGSGTMLVRRHPLTVEGERIGSFDVGLSCGDAPGTYALTYAERRQVTAAGSAGQAAAIDQVRLWIEQTDVKLDILSSSRRADGQPIETVAVATVPAPLVRAFATAAARSLSVQTAAGGLAATSIRIGNAGIGKVFGQLETGCGRGPAKRDAALRDSAVGRDTAVRDAPGRDAPVRDTHARLEAAAR